MKRGQKYLILVKILLSCLIGNCFFVFDSFSQSIQDTTNLIEEVIITATRTKKTISSIPGNCELINKREIEAHAVNNIDDVLRFAGNVNVNRSWGIFSKNSSVTMRGLSGSSRTLILLDGVPLNKLAGGNVNWHIINSESVEGVEIVKGPVSALYGGNAMGGTIQLLSGNKKKENSIKLFYGSENTFGSNVQLSSGEPEVNGLIYNFSSFFRKGDGYIFTSEETATAYDYPLFLTEYGLNSMIGYKFKSGNILTVRYLFYDELRGTGDKVYEENGSYEKIKSNIYSLNFASTWGAFASTMNAYLYNDNYFNQDESVNSFNEYRLLYRKALKKDFGYNWTLSSSIHKKHVITFGTDIRNGNVNSIEDYKTATDFIKYGGSLLLAGLFFQDDYALSSKFDIIAGFRLDYACFMNGELTVKEPTAITGYESGVLESFKTNNWIAFSPKISIRYALLENANTYFSYSTGFMPPKLDDLCKSGKINKGFKIANPELTPEKIANYEIGLNIKYNSHLFFNASGYYSAGSDFHYFLKTGKTITTGTGEEKPVFQRANIGSVAIKGFEFELSNTFLKKFSYKFSYAYNQTEIIDFENNDLYSSIIGKELNESPQHLFNSYLNFASPKIGLITLSYAYTGSQWSDEENLFLLESYDIWNIKISKTFFEKVILSGEIQNMLDKKVVDRKGQMPPGRFIMTSIKLSF
jgi:iron complex outermembrane recepter protein